jgi:hypothetical protein
VTAPAASVAKVSAMQRLLNSMMFFWLLLLVVSFGLAAVIYEVWLKGHI